MPFPRLGTWDSFYGKWNGSHFLTDPDWGKKTLQGSDRGWGGGGAFQFLKKKRKPINVTDEYLSSQRIEKDSK